jgi:hypothetical protein
VEWETNVYEKILSFSVSLWPDGRPRMQCWSRNDALPKIWKNIANRIEDILIRNRKGTRTLNSKNLAAQSQRNCEWFQRWYILIDGWWLLLRGRRPTKNCRILEMKSSSISDTRTLATESARHIARLCRKRAVHKSFSVMLTCKWVGVKHIFL